MRTLRFLEVTEMNFQTGPGSFQFSKGLWILFDFIGQFRNPFDRFLSGIDLYCCPEFLENSTLSFRQLFDSPRRLCVTLAEASILSQGFAVVRSSFQAKFCSYAIDVIFAIFVIWKENHPLYANLFPDFCQLRSRLENFSKTLKCSSGNVECSFDNPIGFFLKKLGFSEKKTWFFFQKR